MSTYGTRVLIVSHVNATEGCRIGDDEPMALADTVIGTDGAVTDLYRFGVREYGRCTGKMYVDRRVKTNDVGGERWEWETEHVGYVFQRRQEYERGYSGRDDGSYLHETWISFGVSYPDADALDDIARVLDGTEWSADTAPAIAEIIGATGRTVRDPDDVEPCDNCGRTDASEPGYSCNTCGAIGDDGPIVEGDDDR